MSNLVAETSILIVDDSPTIRWFLRDALLGLGFKFDISIAKDGMEAVELFKARSFDIIFLDLNMPELGGVGVLAAVKEMGEKTLAVAMSDKLTPKNQALLDGFGAYDFMKKPFTVSTVQHLINSYFLIRMPHRLLLVDDSLTVRKIVRKILQRSIFNLSITEVGSGAEALEAATDDIYRLVFTDLNMPGMNGLELAAALDDISPMSSTIMMSTAFGPELDEAAREVGVMAFLKKPFSSDEIDSILHYAFGMPHAKFSTDVKLFASDRTDRATFGFLRRAFA